MDEMYGLRLLRQILMKPSHGKPDAAEAREAIVALLGIEGAGDSGVLDALELKVAVLQDECVRLTNCITRLETTKVDIKPIQPQDVSGRSVKAASKSRTKKKK